MSARRVHLAIVHPRFARSILEGTKTVEARLARDRRGAYSACQPGDLIVFKRSSGAIFAWARAGTVTREEGLTPRGVERLARAFDARVLAGAAFWTDRAHARCATLIELREPAPVWDPGPVAALLGSAGRAAWKTVTGDLADRAARALRSSARRASA